MAKPSPKPQPIGQNADGSYIYEPAQNMSMMPKKTFTPITSAGTGIPWVGIPGVKGLTTPIVPPMKPGQEAVTFSPERAAQINTPINVKDSLGFSQKINDEDERTVQYRGYFDYLKRNSKLILNDKQSEYIKRFKAKYPDYASVPDATLYGKVILADPKTEEKYGNINMPEFRIHQRKENIKKFVLAGSEKTFTHKVGEHGKKAWKDFGDTVIGAVDTVGSLMKIAENEINMFTGMENSFDNLTYAPAQEAIDRGLGSNLLRTGFSGTSTVLDVVPATAAAQVGFSMMEDIPGLNLVPKALGGAMSLASEGVQMTGIEEEDANNIVGILGNLAFAKGGKRGQAKINKAYREGGLREAVYMTGLQVPQTIIDTALMPLNLGKGIYDKIRGYTKKTPGGAADDTNFSWKQERTGPQKLIGEGPEPVTNGLNPTKFTVMKRGLAEKIIARQWKIKPTIRRDIRQKTGMSAEQFALTKNLVGDDVESSLERAQIFKEAKINEKADIISDWGEAPKTPAMDAMAISLRDNIKRSITEVEGANSPKITGLLDGVNRFLQSPTTTYQQIDALKTLYDHYNPDGLTWDTQGRLVDPIRHENAAWRRSQVQHMIEDEGTARGVDIKEINTNIRGSHDLIKGLSAAEERMANNNIISLGDTQVAIMGSLLGGDVAGVGILAVKKMLGSESATSYIAKKLYNTTNDQTNPRNNSGGNRPGDMIGRFTGSGSDGSGVSSKVNATPTQTVPVVSGPGMSLAVAVNSKSLDIKKAIEQYEKLSKEEQEKALMNSPDLVKIVEVNNRIKAIENFKLDNGYVDESFIQGLVDKWGTYTLDIKKYIEKTLGKEEMSAIQKMNANNMGKKPVVEKAPTERQILAGKEPNADYDRAKGEIYNPNSKTDKKTATNITAAPKDRRGVIVPDDVIQDTKMLPPGSPVWKQMQDGQYQDPKGYLAQVSKDLMTKKEDSLGLGSVWDNGAVKTSDELFAELNARGVVDSEAFINMVMNKETIQDQNLLKLIDDFEKSQEWTNIQYADDIAEMKLQDTEIGLFRTHFGDQAEDILDSVRYMHKAGHIEVTGEIGKNGKKSAYLTRLEDAVNSLNTAKNTDYTPDEVFNIASEYLDEIRRRHGKFQTIATRYAEAPEVSAQQVREILGEDFPVTLVDKLETPEGRKAMGMYYQGAIEIAKNPVSTTGYHEAFHAWTELYGDETVLKKAFDQVKREKGYTKNIDAEEYLAEAFAEWKLAGKGSYTGAVKQFFQTLWNDIKGIIGKADQVIKMFKDVGKKNKVKELQKNLAFQEVGYQSPNGLTTKVLEQLQGRQSVSKEYIQNLLKSAEVKQVERDIFTEKLANFPDKVDVGELSDQVRAELLPLKTNSTNIINEELGADGTAFNRRELAEFKEQGLKVPQYENVTLPSDIRGDVEYYQENIYESPIKTSAGNVHFNGDTENYFGHTRIEDMTDGSTRRVIEVQSDLFQKGNLEKQLEMDLTKSNQWNTPEIAKGQSIEDYRNMRKEQITKLSQYNDPTAHFRMVREEIAQASKDGKTKLQFPTGETAMKIENLGGNMNPDNGRGWMLLGEQTKNGWEDGPELTVQNMKKDNIITDINEDDWIITDVLGDGKFKAVPKDQWTYKWGNKAEGKIWNDLSDAGKKYLEQFQESFDISGKVDTSNPIYKFYENEMQKYLKKFDAKRVTDDQGVEWFEVPIKEEYGKKPVQAFQSENTKLFRGGKDGEFFSEKENIAKAYGDTKEFNISSDAKIKTITSKLSALREYEPSFTPEKRERMYDRMVKEGMVDGKTAEQRMEIVLDDKLKKYISKDGYDGLRMKPDNEYTDTNGEWRVWNKDKIIEQSNTKKFQTVPKSIVDDILNEPAYDATTIKDAIRELQMSNPTVVERFEVPIKEEYGKKPVQAFQQKNMGFSDRLKQGIKTQNDETLYTDAQKMSYKEFIKKNEAYNLDEGGLTDSSGPAHSTIAARDLVPSEYNTWEDFIQDKAKFSDKISQKELASYQEDFTPIVVRNNGTHFEVTEGHHRVANIINLGGGDVPVYFDRWTLKNIWESQNKEKISIDEVRKTYSELFPRMEINKQTAKFQTVPISKTIKVKDTGVEKNRQIPLQSKLDREIIEDNRNIYAKIFRKYIEKTQDLEKSAYLALDKLKSIINNEKITINQILELNKEGYIDLVTFDGTDKIDNTYILNELKEFGLGEKSLIEIIHDQKIPKIEKSGALYLTKEMGSVFKNLSKEHKRDSVTPRLRNTGSFLGEIPDFTGSSRELGLEKLGISDSTIEWLDKWINRYSMRNLQTQVPDEVQKQLSKFKPNKNVILYRGETKSGKTLSTGFLSWTYDKDVAQRFANRGGGEVIKKEFTPSEIVIDFTSLPENLFPKQYSNVEKEVIVKVKND